MKNCASGGRKPLDQGLSTHPVIVNGGEAGLGELGELIVQAAVPAAVGGHADFQGVESFPVLPGVALRAGTGV